ncbi:uncharacterized protein LOC143826153 isoform X1 [Paroedura picta]|uniref:uncharacterized protein LOC143826153 isoform X1 n=1 Tax=Paroedura picta TaxID=143630 RepID=UPI00405762A6
MFKDSSTKRNSTKQPFGKEKTNATDKPFGKEKTYATEKEKTNATEKMGWILAGRHYVKLRMLAEYKNIQVKQEGGKNTILAHSCLHFEPVSVTKRVCIMASWSV